MHLVPKLPGRHQLRIRSADDQLDQSIGGSNGDIILLLMLRSEPGDILIRSFGFSRKNYMKILILHDLGLMSADAVGIEDHNDLGGDHGPVLSQCLQKDLTCRVQILLYDPPGFLPCMDDIIPVHQKVGGTFHSLLNSFLLSTGISGGGASPVGAVPAVSSFRRMLPSLIRMACLLQDGIDLIGTDGLQPFVQPFASSVRIRSGPCRIFGCFLHGISVE